jgi:hypothetical protein
MRIALGKGLLTGILSAAAILLLAPFVIKLALNQLHHFKFKPYLAAHDVNLLIPWAMGLLWAFLALALAAFLVAFDIGFTRSHKPQNHDGR